MKDEGYTQSEIATFKACRYKWYLGYIRRITSKYPVTYFEDGGAFHDALEDIGNDVPMEQVGKNIKENYKGFIKDLRVDFTQALLESYDKRLAMVQGMVAGYDAHYGKDEWHVIQCEEEFCIPFEGTFIRGKKDKKVLQKNKVKLVEHKTSSTIAKSYVSKLPMDQQTLTYSWADWKATGEMVAGIIYDVTKKPSIRQQKDESREEFLNRLRDEYITKPEKYFFRETLHYSKKQLIAFEKNLVKLIARMKDAAENPKEQVYRNEGACSDFGGCAYRSICLNKSLKGRHMDGFYKRKMKHLELGEMNDEKKS